MAMGAAAWIIIIIGFAALFYYLYYYVLYPAGQASHGMLAYQIYSGTCTTGATGTCIPANALRTTVTDVEFVAYANTQAKESGELTVQFSAVNGTRIYSHTFPLTNGTQNLNISNTVALSNFFGQLNINVIATGANGAPVPNLPIVINVDSIPT